MVGRIIFCVATALFCVSLFSPAIVIGEERSISGLQTFFYTLRYGTANLVGARSITDFVVNLLALIATGANFIFVFWALLVMTPTRIPSLKWFWWISLIFILAAAYTGFQAVLSGQVSLERGYFLWLGALILMLVAPVVSRLERKRRKASADRAIAGSSTA
jgi:hypothetical protein